MTSEKTRDPYYSCGSVSFQLPSPDSKAKLVFLGHCIGDHFLPITHYTCLLLRVSPSFLTTDLCVVAPLISANKIIR
jgi:hypothetical protein